MSSYTPRTVPSTTRTETRDMTDAGLNQKWFTDNGQWFHTNAKPWNTVYYKYFHSVRV